MERYVPSISLLALVAVLAVFEPGSANAQTYPSSCKPVGSQHCVAKAPASFIYQARLCLNAQFFETEPEAQQHYVDETGVDNPSPPCPNPEITSLGYANGQGANSAQFPGGFGAACIGSPYGPFPILRGGYDLRNFSLYNLKSYTGGGACTETNRVIGMVERDRGYLCPEGYGANWQSTYCVRNANKPDVGKNLGPGCEQEGQCSVGNPINPGFGNKYQ